MKSIEALRVLSDITASQWGMLTTAQANTLGVTRLDLSRLAEAGHLERLTHGVYKDSGVPSTEFESLRAAWLSTEPKQLAEDRVQEIETGVVVASTSAASLHKIGDFWSDRHEFTAPTRRQSQREDLRFRQRAIKPQDVTLIEGLPVMRIERTIADLLEDVGDLSLVSDALGDAMKNQAIDADRLSELLNPLAERNGFKKNDGAALLGTMSEIAGLDFNSVVRRITADKTLSARITTDYLQSMPLSDQMNEVYEQLGALKRFASSVSPDLLDAMLKAIKPQLDAISKMTPSMEPITGVSKALDNVIDTQVFANVSQQWAKKMNISTATVGRLENARRSGVADKRSTNLTITDASKGDDGDAK